MYRLGQQIVCSLSDTSEDYALEDAPDEDSATRIHLRNELLWLLLESAFLWPPGSQAQWLGDHRTGTGTGTSTAEPRTPSKGDINANANVPAGATSSPPSDICEPAVHELVRTLGFDLPLLCLRPGVHHTSVALALRVLLVMLHSESNRSAFRAALNAADFGGWLACAQLSDTAARVRPMSAAGSDRAASEQQTSGAGGANAAVQSNRHSCCAPGFLALQTLLVAHAHVGQLYIALVALLLGLHKAPAFLPLHTDVRF